LKVVEAVEADWGPVNIMVNNAGVIRDGLFVGMKPEEWNVVIQTNLGGTFNFCHAVAMKLARQRKGRIINISSVAAEHTNPSPTTSPRRRCSWPAPTRRTSPARSSRSTAA